jgi:hypothetical protein
MNRREFIAGLGGPVVPPIVVAFMLFWPSNVFAHDIYGTLKNGHGVSCCGGNDCQPAHYRITANGVEMLVGGRWIVVPNEMIQYRTLSGDTGETGGGHWCGVADDFISVTLCAILPPSSALLIEDGKKSTGRPRFLPELPQ